MTEEAPFIKTIKIANCPYCKEQLMINYDNPAYVNRRIRIDDGQVLHFTGDSRYRDSTSLAGYYCSPVCLMNFLKVTLGAIEKPEVEEEQETPNAELNKWLKKGTAIKEL
jgi:hypothetical protein